MLKNFPWKTVVLTLLAWMLFWEAKETITGERMFFLVRWWCYDMGHAKNMEVLAYTLTDDQVSYLFSHPEETVRQPTERELGSKSVNVVLRIRNQGDGLAWGRLSWRHIGGGWNVVDVDDVPGKSSPGKYADVVLSIGKFPSTQTDSPPEPIKLKWNELYVYH